MLFIKELPEEKALLLSGTNLSIKVIDYTTMGKKNQNSSTLNTILHNVLSYANVKHTIIDTKQPWEYKGSPTGKIYVSEMYDPYEKLSYVALSGCNGDDDDYENYLVELVVLGGQASDFFALLENSGVPFEKE